MRCLGDTLFEPAAMTGINYSTKVTKQEPFAPLAPINAFQDAAETIMMANEKKYGLASYSTPRIHGVCGVAEAPERGMVGVSRSTFELALPWIGALLSRQAPGAGRCQRPTMPLATAANRTLIGRRGTPADYA